MLNSHLGGGDSFIQHIKNLLVAKKVMKKNHKKILLYMVIAILLLAAIIIAIILTSKEGEFAKFTFTLPLYKD